MSPRRRLALTIVALAVVLGMVGCTVDGKPYPEGVAQPKGHVDTDRFDKLTLECQILSPSQIGKAVGGAVGSPAFNGAICRWTVFGPSVMTVTFNWFECHRRAAHRQEDGLCHREHQDQRQLRVHPDQVRPQHLRRYCQGPQPWCLHLVRRVGRSAGGRPLRRRQEADGTGAEDQRLTWAGAAIGLRRLNPPRPKELF